MMHGHCCYKEILMPTGIAHTTQPAARCCTTDDHDLALIQRIAAGDRQAFEQLYHQYARRLTAYLARVLWQTDQVEDTLHDVLLAIWKQAPAYQPIGRVSAWIFGIAHHKALKARMTAARQVPERFPPRLDASDTATPEAGLMYQERDQAVAAALAALRPEQRAVVELAYYHHYSYEEIATLLACPVNTVKTRMLKARRHLATHLSRLGLEPSSGKRTAADSPAVVPLPAAGSPAGDQLCDADHAMPGEPFTLCPGLLGNNGNGSPARHIVVPGAASAG
jgi:RNA polymerase sigma-70 factor (ECF subfamily)